MRESRTEIELIDVFDSWQEATIKNSVFELFITVAGDFATHRHQEHRSIVAWAWYFEEHHSLY